MGFYWVLLGFTGFYGVLLGFTGFYGVLLGFTEFYLVLLGFTWFYGVLLGFTRLYRVLLDLTGFHGGHRVLLDFAGFNWFLLAYKDIWHLPDESWGFTGFFTEFYWVLLGFPWFSMVLLGFTEFYLVLLGFTGFYWVLSGFTQFYWIWLFFSGLDRVFLSFNEIYQTSCLQWDGFFRETFTVQWIIHWFGKPTAGETIKSTVEFNETSLNWRRNESIIQEPKKTKFVTPVNENLKKNQPGQWKRFNFLFPHTKRGSWLAADLSPTNQRPRCACVRPRKIPPGDDDDDDDDDDDGENERCWWCHRLFLSLPPSPVPSNF